LQIEGAGRNSKKQPTPFVGNKPNGKSQFITCHAAPSPQSSPPRGRGSRNPSPFIATSGNGFQTIPPPKSCWWIRLRWPPAKNYSAGSFTN
jgi:hypothetical protein